MSSTGIIAAHSNAIALPPTDNQLATDVAADIRTMVGYLHQAVHPVQWMAAVINELNKIEEPQKLEMKSVWETIEKLAQTGLYAGSALGHAYLVPFGKQLQLIVGYKGFIELGMANGSIKGVATDWVLKGENASLTRSLDGESVADFKHDVPLGGRQEATPETIEVAYCIYETGAGFRNVVVREKKELLDLQRKASAKSPWRMGRYAAMCLKSAVRPATKYWRQTNELAIAVQADEETERAWEQKQPFEAPAADESAPKARTRAERHADPEVTTANLVTLYRTWLAHFKRTDDAESRAAFPKWQEGITGILAADSVKPESWSMVKLAECMGRLKL